MNGQLWPGSWNGIEFDFTVAVCQWLFGGEYI